MNRQQANEIYSKEFIKFQKEEIFPDEFLPAEYDLWKHAALNYVSVAFIRQNFPITWKEYKELLVKTKSFSLFEASLINTVLEHRTPRELDPLVGENFYNIMDQMINMNKKWSEITKPFEEGLAKRIEIMSASQKGNFKEGRLARLNGDHNENNFLQ